MAVTTTTAIPEHSIIVGEVFACDKPAIVSTLLGSCVAACLYDATAQVGGMNHFMLPASHREVANAAFGVHAMEHLIDAIIKLGGDRHRLQAKVFGGASVLALRGAELQVGNRNANFVRTFLDDAGIPIVAHRLGGTRGVKLSFETATARAFVKPLPNHLLHDTLEKEIAYLHQKVAHPAPASNTETIFECE